MPEDAFNVHFLSEKYNIFEFLNNHPGGVNYVQPYRGKDIQDRMQKTDHSKAAYYLLQEYKLGGRNNSPLVSDEEDLEKLVDWEKPMLSQVAGLGPKYKDWVVMPVDRHLQLFGNPILEYMTITHWFVVPIVWLPVIAFLIAYGSRNYSQITGDPLPVLSAVLSVLSGVIIWTLIEYSLHRWVFHIEPSGNSKIMIYIHFAIHGLHHKVPFDTRRLVFPPLPAAVLAFAMYKFFSFILPESLILLIIAGGILGYVGYDMIHFYLHHGSPKENTYFYNLKRYHNQHHFAHSNSGFGISSLFWDTVFGTVIQLKNLKLGIKW